MQVGHDELLALAGEMPQERAHAGPVRVCPAVLQQPGDESLVDVLALRPLPFEAALVTFRVSSAVATIATAATSTEATIERPSRPGTTGAPVPRRASPVTAGCEEPVNTRHPGRVRPDRQRFFTTRCEVAAMSEPGRADEAPSFPPPPRGRAPWSAPLSGTARRSRSRPRRAPAGPPRTGHGAGRAPSAELLGDRSRGRTLRRPGRGRPPGRRAGARRHAHTDPGRWSGRAGDVLVEVTGRPVIALTGPLPAYRDLVVGDIGPDVAQLEQALAAIGFDPGEPDDDTFTQRRPPRSRFYDAGLPARDRRRPRDVTPEPPAPDRHRRAADERGRYVPTLPRRLDRFPARVGGLLPKAPVLLSGTRLVLPRRADHRRRAPAEGRHARRGRRARRKKVTGHLGAVRRTATGGARPCCSRRWTRRPTGAPGRRREGDRAPAEHVGKALLVPLAALSTDARGGPRRARGGGRQHRTVRVRVGLSAEGYAEVRPAGRAVRGRPGRGGR